MKYTYLLLFTSIFIACNQSKNNSEKQEVSEISQKNTIKIDSTNIVKKVEDVNIENEGEQLEITQAISYEGMLNGKKIYLKIENSKDYISSSYQEKDSTKIIHLNDNSKDGKTILEAYDYENDKMTTIGFFEGVITTNSFKGTWFSVNRTSSAPFELTNNVIPFQFSFDMNINETEDEYDISKTIKVKNTNTNNIIQDFQLEQSLLNNDLIIEDMNFDNFLDFRLVEFIAANGNSNYSCWLFNPSTNKFEHSTILSEMSTPRFDHQKKQVNSSWKNGYGNYGGENYQFQNNNYFLIEKYTWEMDENDQETETSTKYKIIDGKSVEIN